MEQNIENVAEPQAELTMAEIDAGDTIPEIVEQAAPETESSEVAPQEVVETALPEQAYFNKKIDKLSSEKYQYRNKAENLERELADLRQQVGTKPSKEKSAPKLEDFDYDEERFSNARVDYRVEVALAARDKVSATQAAQRVESERIGKFVDREHAFEKQAPNYREAIQALPPFQPETLKAFELMENGPAIAYHLAQNAELANKISTLDPVSAAIELGRVSQGLGTTKTKPVRTSNAPAPITPVKSSGGSLSKAPEDMSMDELYNSDI